MKGMPLAYPCAYELLDAVLSAFVKGEYNIATDAPMRFLRKAMTGNAVGALCRQADVPPIIHDFAVDRHLDKGGIHLYTPFIFPDFPHQVPVTFQLEGFRQGT